MTTQLSPEHQILVDQILEVAEYENSDHVITEALNLLKERDQRLKWLRAEIQKGIDSFERGESVEYTPELLEQVARKASERITRGEPVRDELH